MRVESPLERLLGDSKGACREGLHGSFLTPMPWSGPAAHLHIVFKPAPEKALRDASTRLRFPNDLQQLLAAHNGAVLFRGDLAVYGVHEEGQLLNRTDPFARLPFNIEWENDSWWLDRDRLLVVGGYRFDGSRACIDRETSRITVFPRNGDEPLVVFRNLDDWLGKEISRYQQLYSVEGQLLGDADETGPPGAAGRRSPS